MAIGDSRPEAYVVIDAPGGRGSTVTVACGAAGGRITRACKAGAGASWLRIAISPKANKLANKNKETFIVTPFHGWGSVNRISAEEQRRWTAPTGASAVARIAPSAHLW